MNLTPRSAFAVALSLAAAAASFTFAPSAQAFSSCKADADCAAGFFCELVPAPSVGCASPDGQPNECPEPGPAPAVEGYCREKPIECKADADCPAYLACVEAGGGDVTCSAPACPPGGDCPEPVCEEPKKDPNAPKLCAPKMIECTSDAQCPQDFACNIELGVACPAIACDPTDANCKQPECDQSAAKKLCGPKMIDCKADGDCPTDWRCLSFEEGSCSGGGSTEPPSGGGSEPAPAPSPGSKFADECSSTTRNLCVPKGYIAGIEQGGSFDNAQGSPMAEAGGTKNDGSKAPSYSAPRGSDTQPTSGGSTEPSGDGCSTSNRGQGAGLLSVLLVGLAARLARRRSR
jgi:hypothetical protein